MTALTPEEARTQWCPFAGKAGGRLMHLEDGDNCIAEACMAWRWQSSLSVQNPTRSPGGASQTIKRERGYCGAAGRP